MSLCPVSHAGIWMCGHECTWQDPRVCASGHVCAYLCTVVYMCCFSLFFSMPFICLSILSAHVFIHICADEYMCMCFSHCDPMFSYCLNGSMQLSSYVHECTAECGSLYMSVHCIFMLAWMSVYLLCMCVCVSGCVLLCMCLKVHTSVYICESVLMHIVYTCKCECASLTCMCNVFLCMYESVYSMPACLCLYACDSVYVPRKKIQQDEFLLMLCTYNYWILFWNEALLKILKCIWPDLYRITKLLAISYHLISWITCKADNFRSRATQCVQGGVGI